MPTPPPENEAVEQPLDPTYLALPEADRQELDQMVAVVQAMQNEVDLTVRVMGEPIFYIGKMLLEHELAVRSLRQRLAELEARES